MSSKYRFSIDTLHQRNALQYFRNLAVLDISAIDDSSGESEILITPIRSEQVAFDDINRLSTQGETIGTAGASLYKDGVPYTCNSANPNDGQGFLRQTARMARTCALRANIKKQATKTIAPCQDSIKANSQEHSVVYFKSSFARLLQAERIIVKG